MDIAVGDIVRHNKRGTRYRIIAQFHAALKEDMDGARMDFWADTFDLADNGGFSLSLPGHAGQGRNLAIMIPVMVQVSGGDADRSDACLLYTSLDAPGQFFVRAASEFTPDRFFRIDTSDVYAASLARMMPEEIAHVLVCAERLFSGHDMTGTALEAMAIAMIASGIEPEGSSLDACMRKIAKAALRISDNGNGEFFVTPTLSADASETVVFMAMKFEMSISEVIDDHLGLSEPDEDQT